MRIERQIDDLSLEQFKLEKNKKNMEIPENDTTQIPDEENKADHDEDKQNLDQIDGQIKALKKELEIWQNRDAWIKKTEYNYKQAKEADQKAKEQLDQASSLLEQAMLEKENALNAKIVYLEQKDKEIKDKEKDEEKKKEIEINL